MNYKNATKNLILGVGGQIIILLLGFVLPRLILTYYGSEVNGLLATTVQIFTYIALLQSGIGNASVNLLYRAVAQNNREDIENIVNATVTYFKKVSMYYLVALIIVTTIFPYIIKTNIAPQTIALVILFQGLPGLVNFYYVVAYEQLLNAEGKNYVVSSINLAIKVISSSIKIILIVMGYNIVLVQISFFIVSILKVLMIRSYYRSRYSWLNIRRVNTEISVLSERNAFMVHEISNTIFNSTDVLTLSIFSGLGQASIYTVYNLVFSSLNIFISTLNNSFVYILGQTYHKNRSKYIRLHNAYDNFYITLVFSIMSTAYVLIIPFIKLYTEGVDDISYVNSYLPILFVSIHLLSSSRAVSARLITIAGHAKNTQINTIIEASINLVVSVILVNLIGIYGVLIGSIVALTYRTNDIIVYANKKILKRSVISTYKHFVLNLIIFFVIVFLSRQLNIVAHSYFDFILYGIVTTLLMFVIFFGINCLINYDLYKLLITKNIKKNIKEG